MATDEEFDTFSIRLPSALAKELRARAKIQKRSRNSEIHFLIEYAINLQIEKDKEIADEIRRINHPDNQSSAT